MAGPEDRPRAKRAVRAGKDNDPFPSIPPSLLNAADIEDYALNIGLIEPFLSERLSKPASYAIGVGRLYATAEPIVGREDAWEWQFKTVDDPYEAIPLPPNSLIYVALDTKIRLPLYIAARFNLAIKHVYRGLLAGTGPLVDPGFSGDLYIPLHNLSSRQYNLRPGERFIWMEFTKLSPNATWHDIGATEPARVGVIRGFPDEKKKRDDLRDYLDYASDSPIRSSIRFVYDDVVRIATAAATSADDAKTEANRVRLITQRFGWGAVLIFATTLIALWIQVLSLVNDVRSDLQTNLSPTTLAPTPVSTAPPPTATTATPPPTRGP